MPQTFLKSNQGRMSQSEDIFLARNELVPMHSPLSPRDGSLTRVNHHQKKKQYVNIKC